MSQPRAADAVAAWFASAPGRFPRLIDLGLGRLERVLERLGAPHRALPPVLHVAGTNGKGSTIAFARAAAEAAGMKVQAYTSPHLIAYRERVWLPDGPVADARFIAALERVAAATGADPLTQFEALTAAAFLLFAATPADLCLLEVGLGGRLDATNIVPRAASTAIARLSMDHRQFLGETLAAIAGEKAGIARAGVPLFLGRQTGETAIITVAATAEAAGARLCLWGREFGAAPASPGWTLHLGNRALALPPPALPGAHQLENAALALAAVEPILGPMSAAVATAAMARVAWPARLQRLTTGPLVSALSLDRSVWLDGGHNDSGGAALAAWAAGQPGRLTLIVGMIDSKVPEEFLAPLAPYAARLVAIAAPGGERPGLPAAAVAAAARRAGFARVDEAADEDEAARRLAAQGDTHDVLICGSLYLAGRVLAAGNG